MERQLNMQQQEVTHEFFMPLLIPSVTHQEKQVHVVKGKPMFYEPAELKAARTKYMDNLAQHLPDKKFNGKVRLMIKWLFPIKGKHVNGEYKDTKPDLDNSVKLLQDCMTKLGFWKDDRFVVSLITEKFWSDVPGIYINIEEVE